MMFFNFLMFTNILILVTANDESNSMESTTHVISSTTITTHRIRHHHRQHGNHPKIINGNTNISTFEGDTVVLPCEISNLEKNHVIWFKIANDGSPSTLTVGYEQFSRNMRYRVIRPNDRNDSSTIEYWNFEIRKVSKEDEGLYQCHVKINQKYQIKIDVFLEVCDKDRSSSEDSYQYLADNYIPDKPKSDYMRTLPKDVEKVELPINSWVKLKCNEINTSLYRSAARNTHDIQWFKDGKIIEGDPKRSKKSSSISTNEIELEFFSTNPKDSGMYQCKRNTKVLKNIFLHVYENKSSTKSIQVMLIVFTNLFILFSENFLI